MLQRCDQSAAWGGDFGGSRGHRRLPSVSVGPKEKGAVGQGSTAFILQGQRNTDAISLEVAVTGQLSSACLKRRRLPKARPPYPVCLPKGKGVLAGGGASTALYVDY